MEQYIVHINDIGSALLRDLLTDRTHQLRLSSSISSTGNISLHRVMPLYSVPLLRRPDLLKPSLKLAASCSPPQEQTRQAFGVVQLDYLINSIHISVRRRLDTIV